MEKHHALVYLSPAGDPEFGETKPFMVDLRGIEEIARLHLLHNVTARGPQPDEEVAAEPPQSSIVPGGLLPKSLGQAIQAMSPVIKPAVDAVSQTAAKVMPDPVKAQATAAEVQNRPPFPFAPGPAPTVSHMQSSAPAAASAQPVAPPENQPAASVSASNEGLKICQHCQKPAGKGRFCIECGKFVGQANNQTGAPDNLRAAVHDGASLPASQFGQYQNEQSAEAKPPFPTSANMHRKPPVTSLNADLTKIGLPQANDVQTQINSNKGQTGIEF